MATSTTAAPSSPPPPHSADSKQSDGPEVPPSSQPHEEASPDAKGKGKDIDPEPQAGDSSASPSDSAGSPTPAASSSTTPAPAAPAVTASAGDWQAIFSPAHNAYYFYNTQTQETTWTNPLQPAPPAGASADPSAPGSSALPVSASAPAIAAMYDLQAAAAAQGIDPALAHLDPSLAAGPSNPAAFTYTAKFNARTGTFARPDGRDPSHLSEYERAKRMSEFYFDVNAWEQEVEARKLEEAHEEESKKRKRPTKKDLERFKEQKKQKKIAKTAWLRT
ncbi:uncharacterized protein C8Q71DRAFT_714470 [Rhodofomes roseus]|uniref:WW domain-containing protein n=1 Tax=Rhodofomes roseus TaxID=34475 RepID=A0ABQ8K5A9_9APHY|nr:uncharacterized protein C8Q71DRAFT_714470 [Rhodofomes roseus]KAH9832151.1 hypothetical protein C8Q71DRAFT_714470 [Rhodofomes roseus]